MTYILYKCDSDTEITETISYEVILSEISQIFILS